MRLAFFLLLFGCLNATMATAEVGALQTDCKLGGKREDGSYQFVATCAARAPSPNGSLAIVQKAYTEKQPTIELQDTRGRTLARLKSLSDDMPIVVNWAPNSRWLYVNHHVGSFMEVLQVFEIVGQTAIERPALVTSAASIAAMRYPCLPKGAVLPNGVRWTRDSTKIVLVTISRADACIRDGSKHPGTWHSLWMMGDVRSGSIIPASIRVQPDEKPFAIPIGGVYSQD